MKKKMTLTTLLMLSALTLVACGTTTDEKIDTTAESVQEQVEDTTDLTNTEELYVNEEANETEVVDSTEDVEANIDTSVE